MGLSPPFVTVPEKLSHLCKTFDSPQDLVTYPIYCLGGGREKYLMLRFIALTLLLAAPQEFTPVEQGISAEAEEFSQARSSMSSDDWTEQLDALGTPGLPRTHRRGSYHIAMRS